jgi:hypothetical protein
LAGMMGGTRWVREVQKPIVFGDAVEVAIKKQVVMRPVRTVVEKRYVDLPVKEAILRKPIKKTVIQKLAVERAVVQETFNSCKMATKKVLNPSMVDPLGLGSSDQSRLHNGPGLMDCDAQGDSASGGET